MNDKLAEVKIELSEHQLHWLRHMLGINTPELKNPKPYRNYAAVNPGDQTFAALTALGLVELYRAHDGGNSYDYYRCTEAGKDAAFKSFKQKRWPRSKRVYSRFLDTRESIPDLTFKSFLTSPDYADIRSRA